MSHKIFTCFVLAAGHFLYMQFFLAFCVFGQILSLFYLFISTKSQQNQLKALYILRTIFYSYKEKSNTPSRAALATVEKKNLLWGLFTLNDCTADYGCDLVVTTRWTQMLPVWFSLCCWKSLRLCNVSASCSHKGFFKTCLIFTTDIWDQRHQNWVRPTVATALPESSFVWQSSLIPNSFYRIYRNLGSL